MIEKFYPNPIVVQRLQAGPLSAHIDTFAQQLFDAGEPIALLCSP